MNLKYSQRSELSMDNGIRQRKDANQSSSSRPQRPSNGRCRSDSISSTPEGYIHKNFTMGIKSPHDYHDQLWDQKMFDILEARYLCSYLSLLVAGFICPT